MVKALTATRPRPYAPLDAPDDSLSDPEDKGGQADRSVSAPSRKMRGLGVVISRILNIQHRINPLHIYCRLVEGGLDRRVSLAFCRYYEHLVFFWLRRVLKTIMYVQFFFDREYSLERAIRKR
jgi:hypothetical protein